MSPDGHLARTCATSDDTWRAHGDAGAASAPSRPQPCIQKTSIAPTSTLPASTIDARHDILRHYRQAGMTHAHHNASVSSAGGSSTRTSHTIDSIDLEKGVLRVEQRSQPHSKRSSHRQSRSDMAERRVPSVVHGSVPSQRSVVRTGELEELPREDELDGKAVKLLMFLSGPLVALSFGTLVCALFFSIFSILIQPARLCTRRPGLREQLVSLIGPLLNLHLRCIYSLTETSDVSIPMVLFVLLLSPLLALGVAVWSWIIAIYWVFAAMVGNPDGLDGRDDGRELVLSLQRWWEGWLLTAVAAT